jgi:hypothetical protein
MIVATQPLQDEDIVNLVHFLASRAAGNPATARRSGRPSAGVRPRR